MSDHAIVLSLPVGDRSVSFRLGNRNGMDFIACRLAATGLAQYEAPMPALVVDLVAGDGVMLDIGANNGMFSLLAAAASAELEVYAFEPLPEAWDILTENLALNPDLTRRIHAQHLALSSSSGPVAFFKTINEFGFLSTSSSIEESHARSVGRGVFEREEVMSQTLDAWAAEHLAGRKISFIKMDVERHEHAVLEGGWNIVREQRPIIVFEVLPDAQAESIERLIAEERYLHFAIAPDRFRFLPHVHYVHGAENHLLCPAERADKFLMLARRHGLGIDIR